MSQTLSLFRLQQVDSQIDLVHTRLQANQKILEDGGELSLAKQKADSTHSHCQTADKELKKAELEAQNQRIKIEQTEASLYAGKGHSPKELQDLQNDVAALKRHLVILEDVQLEAMINMENTIASNQSAQAELQAAQNHADEQNRGLQEEQGSLQKELEKLLSERSAAADPIPQDALSKYNQLRQQRRGLAVAAIKDNSCSACGSGITAAQMQSSRASGQVEFCPSCGRILYGS
jgi:predicted  nucleic acid-binding Zn-ribbon protein